MDNLPPLNQFVKPYYKDGQGSKSIGEPEWRPHPKNALSVPNRLNNSVRYGYHCFLFLVEWNVFWGSQSSNNNNITTNSNNISTNKTTTKNKKKKEFQWKKGRRKKKMINLTPWKIIFVLIIFCSEVVMVWTGFQGFAVPHKRIIHIHAPL